MEFIGFPRPDGSIGIRNHVILVGMGLSGLGVCHKVAGLVTEAVPVFLDSENGIFLSDIVRHPNVAGMMVVEDGLEEEFIGPFVDELERTGKPHDVVDIGGLGSIEATSKTTRAVIEIIRDVSTQRRELVKFSKLLPGLLNIHASLMANTLQGFVQLVMDENGRCLWVEKETEDHAELSRDIKKTLAGDWKPGQTPGPNPGMYKYAGPQKSNSIWRAIAASGAQVIVYPADTGQRLAHALIPGVGFTIDQKLGPSIICELNLSKMKEEQMTVDNAGLLLLSEVLATASGKFTREEILGGVVVATMKKGDR